MDTAQSGSYRRQAGGTCWIDETWVGGRTRGEGRGVHHKVLVACAVEVRHRKPGTAQDKRSSRTLCRACQARRSTRSERRLALWVRGGAVAPRTHRHWPLEWICQPRQARDEHFAVAECGRPRTVAEAICRIHLVFACLKTWLIGMIRCCHQHLQAYLKEFTFRFNRASTHSTVRSLLGIAGDVSAPTFDELYSGLNGSRYFNGERWGTGTNLYSLPS